jgi:hypothetical protein
MPRSLDLNARAANLTVGKRFRPLELNFTFAQMKTFLTIGWGKLGAAA